MREPCSFGQTCGSTGGDERGWGRSCNCFVEDSDPVVLAMSKELLKGTSYGSVGVHC